MCTGNCAVHRARERGEPTLQLKSRADLRSWEKSQEVEAPSGAGTRPDLHRGQGRPVRHAGISAEPGAGTILANCREPRFRRYVVFCALLQPRRVEYLRGYQGADRAGEIQQRKSRNDDKDDGSGRELRARPDFGAYAGRRKVDGPNLDSARDGLALELERRVRKGVGHGPRDDLQAFGLIGL